MIRVFTAPFVAFYPLQSIKRKSSPLNRSTRSAPMRARRRRTSDHHRACAQKRGSSRIPPPSLTALRDESANLCSPLASGQQYACADRQRLPLQLPPRGIPLAHRPARDPQLRMRSAAAICSLRFVAARRGKVTSETRRRAEPTRKQRAAAPRGRPKRGPNSLCRSEMSK